MIRMKKSLLALAVAGLFVANLARAEDAVPQKPPAPEAPAAGEKFLSDLDKVSYGFGLTIGRNILSMKESDGVNLNLALFREGLEDALAQSNPQLTDDQIQQAMIAFQTQLMLEAQAKQAAEAASNLAIATKFLEENKTREGVKTTESGLQYLTLVEGTGISPTKEDTVKVHYTGTLADGKKFDSSVDRGDPIEFPLSGVIPGWTEGLQLMKVGGKTKFFIPPDLAYGVEGRPPVIPGNSLLIFEVELLDVIKPAKDTAGEAKNEATEPSAEKPNG